MNKRLRLTTAFIFQMLFASFACAEFKAFDTEELKMDFEARERFEFRNNWKDFSDHFDLRDDVGLLQRVRLGLRFKPNDHFSTYIQAQDSRTFFDEPEGPPANREFTGSDSPIDLRQAYVRFKNIYDQPIQLTVGRQALTFASSRMIGNSAWSNNGTSFDAVQIEYDLKDKLLLSYFAGHMVKHERDRFNSPDTEDLITGIFAAPVIQENIVTDFYLFYRDKSDVDSEPDRQAGNSAPEGRYFALGSKLRNKKDDPFWKGFDWKVEVIGEVGQVKDPTALGTRNTNDQDLLAGLINLEGGYTFKETTFKPRLFAEYYFATGDSNANDESSNTFQNFFPSTHGEFGNMDLFAITNLHDISAGVHFDFTDKWRMKLAQHVFFIADSNDILRDGSYSPIGGVNRYNNAVNGGPDGFIGSELDLMMTYKASEWCEIEGGYSHFFAANYLEQTQPFQNASRSTDDADFFYIQTKFKF
jgi:hypothetical protein